MNILDKTIQTITQYLPTLRQDNTRYDNIPIYTHHPITNQTDLQIYYQAIKCPVIYRCNKVFKNTALACDFNIDSDTQEQDTIPTREYLLRLFNEPNGFNSNTTWADITSLMWDSYGNMGDCFFEISTDNDYNILNGFRYIHNNQIVWNNETECYSLLEQPDVEYEPDDLIHIREPNIEQEMLPWGISKINRAAGLIALYQNSLNYNNNILANDGLDPNLIISFDEQVSSRNMQAELDRLYNDRSSKKHRILALKNATVQKTSYQNQDMAYLNLLNYAEDAIVRLYGIPPQIYGKIETANLGSGSGDSQKKDWKTTFEGECKFIENAFNNTLKHHGFSERFHYQQMDVIDELYNAQVDEILIRTGVKTVDEARNERGMDKLTSNMWNDYYGL